MVIHSSGQTGKGVNINNQEEIIKAGFRGEEEHLERTGVSEAVKGWEERLTTE